MEDPNWRYNWRLFHDIRDRFRDLPQRNQPVVKVNNEPPMPDAPSNATGDKVLIHMLTLKLRLPCICQCVVSCVIMFSFSHQRVSDGEWLSAAVINYG